ncbi:MAG TPA: UDP-glucose/GDP-mannose dehydrogenase family protein [Methanofastidiosum sp.]|nr:UDP-glucose/GDP-mannose dehydrogenase family protein [Methanofastidiosum sp.]HNU61839.1 UDP-glucose/GDP-mannose dehydrogenase family protein [Methanofastidiosum sp.]
MNITVVGAGYVGLTTALGYANLKHKVFCYDNDLEKIKLLKKGKLPFFEKGLQELLPLNLNKNFVATDTLIDSLDKSSMIFICVGTPSLNNGKIDLEYIFQSCKEIGMNLKSCKDYKTIVIKSTVIPKTTEELIIPIIEKYSSKKIQIDFDVKVIPEFFQEGNALHNFFNPDRIIIGQINSSNNLLIDELYSSFTCPVLKVSLATAEMIKYSSNAFLSCKISFINEIGNICKLLGLDVYEVANGMGYDPRIGPYFLNAGPGFGGSCFTKDLQALIKKAESLDYTPLLLQSILEVNNNQPLKVINLIKKKFNKIDSLKIGVLGLSFKEGTDDVRESPAIYIIKELINLNLIIHAYDPMALPNMKKKFPNIKYFENPQELINNSDVILIVTAWPQFKNLNYIGKYVIDTRKVIDNKKGVDYEGLCW